jgi:EAL domain-containing protein (putative c-di-GMP-specific phosphodiesterase class I)/FixJ family two-component response regulator
MTQRLLVIDDEVAVCDLVAKVATEFGFDVTAMQNVGGIDADILAGFDILVLDLLMPNTDGIQFLRQYSGSMRMPRLLLMSGLDRRTLESARQLVETKGLEVCDILQKPFRALALQVIFEKHCGHSAAPRQVAALQRAGPVITLTDIDTAIERGELVVHFQPQVALADGRWCGVEALVRWQHPVHGLLYPDSFVALVESSALALAFTEAVIRSAIKGVKALARTAGFTGDLSVNMPPSALTEIMFPERLDSLLVELDFDRKKFILEITETSIPQNLETSLDIQTRLSMRGIRLSIDDFGTGHSSLERLHASPFGELKIDIVFVRRADHDPGARAIIQNAIALSKSLDMKVVAEGVETAQTFAWLKAMGCDVAQGFFISRPQPAEILAGWMFALPQWPNPIESLCSLPSRESMLALA